ncbi:hypothetical protein PN419_06715 [Halorubrum ezzemoulense]|uniref:hypothetical protein n=2 Tax=Halorubrum ezzemoulense TaxID=337243 RepID=UPI00211B027D|nr:hypothetical protein [Halorubrum ezzemoulense]MDB2224271.1 hypothetical protein [Halorubrum ezzemoulense]MDB2238204.1 hypothetical protein [Halorubrum ezzemoulense]MDB2240143.1 hypothetical protein [Halorubrum ezzemoulense]MDB2247673.1 hypothetical protein [Halorubrum ezzemoulense]MDB2263885.1 hypothetical protein [Halorubrum ezzemoulense]
MERRKFIVGLGALASGSAAAMGTGAFTAAELDGREANIGVVNDSNGLIGLQSGGSEYVTNTGGSGENELMIDLSSTGGGEGVNPNSTYQVGGLGQFDSSNIDLVPGDPTVDPPVGQVAIDTTTLISEEYAFKVMNQTDSPKDIEVTYNANDEPFPDGTRLFLVAYYPEGGDSSEQEEGLVVGSVANENAKSASIIFDDDQQYSASIGSGKEFFVTILVDVGGAASGTDLGGTLTVRAGSHDDFTNADAGT